MKINLNGTTTDFNACVALMDDDLREEISADLAPCTEQEFINEYCKRHFAKYGIGFEI